MFCYNSLKAKNNFILPGRNHNELSIETYALAIFLPQRLQGSIPIDNGAQRIIRHYLVPYTYL